MDAVLNQRASVAHEIKNFVCNPHDSLQLIVFAYMPPSQNVLLLHVTRAAATAVVSEYDHCYEEKEPRWCLDDYTLYSDIA